MKHFIVLIIFLVFSNFTMANLVEKPDTLFQVATIGSLVRGVYDGDYPYKKLFEHGDFGLGTFNHLDGEMVAVDGNFYQIKSNGKLRRVQPTDLTPFAEVTFFVPHQQFDIKSVKNFYELTKILEQSFSNKNIPYAFRIDGDFSSIQLRSVSAQKKPYPPLTEAVKHQNIFNLKNTRGTIVGFWFPKYWSGIAVPGSHLHFITADHTTGGHVLELAVTKGRISLAALHVIALSLPDTQNFAHADLNDKTMETAIDKAEKNPVNRP